MSFPTLKVEVAFGYDPLDTAPTWTDITDYVSPQQPVKIARGRNDPWSPFRPGQATLRLDDFAERRFDPTHTTGPYFGNLKPRVQIRIQATVAGTDYPVFRGWVTSWPQLLTGDTPRAGSVELVCYDALEWASGVRCSDDLVDDIVGLMAPVLWLRQADTRWIDRMGGSYGPSVTAGVFTTATSLASGLRSSAVQFAGGCWLTTANTWERTSGAWTIAFWVQTTAVSQTIATRWCNVIGTDGYQLTIDANGRLDWYARNQPIGSPVSTRITSTNAINDGKPHWVTLVCDGVNAFTLYIDGVADATAVRADGAGGGNYKAGVDRFCGDGNTFSASGVYYSTPSVTFQGTLQDFAVFESALSASEVDSIWKHSVEFLEEDSAARFGRITSYVGWPGGGWSDITSDPRARVGRLAFTGQSLLTALRELEASEQGKVFAAKDGKLTFLGRYHHQDVTRGKTVQAVFSDDGSDYPYETWRYVETDSDVRNDITVTTPVAQSRSTDATSIATYGRQSETIDTILSTYTQAKDMAAGLVYRWKNAVGRVAPFWVDPTHGGAWVTLLGLELGDRIQVEATPMGVGSQLVEELLVDSIEWEISSWVWRLRLGGAPVPAKTFVLGESTLGGPDPLGF